MWTKQHKQRKTGRLIVPGIALAFLSYFGFHAYHGEYGIYSKYQLEARISQLNEELGERTSERVALERKVQMLRDGTIDRDMVDEFARRQLDFARPNELTVMLPKNN
ncbi:MAG: septum formation initiator family protein [Rhizobiaceae bacterium]|nr:septum formation initiator family protein [Rhizobiaceae bacterium]